MSEELNEMSREQLVGEVLLVRSRLADAQARAERAEGERDGLVIDCERLATDLEQALRQWKMYTDERENEDLDKEDHIEALSYRSCVKTAKDWRDKAFSLTHPSLTPAPQGRTDGDVGYHVGVCMSCGSISRAKNLQSAPATCWGCEGEMLWGKVPVKGAFRDAAMDATAPEVKGGAA